MRGRLASLLALPLLAACLGPEDGSPVLYSPARGPGYGGMSSAPPGYGGLRMAEGLNPFNRGSLNPFNQGYGNQGRTFRPSGNVVCDRATQVCYRRGRIDKSETEDVFGERAGDRADDYRDRFGRDDLYVRNRNVACDRRSHVCYKNGHPDRSETRAVFGKGAARNID